MGTAYTLICSHCSKQSGNTFTSQMWGWGNADIVATFQFIMKHTAECRESFKVLADYDDSSAFPVDESEDLKSYFPYSDEWNDKAEKAAKEHHDYINRKIPRLNSTFY